MCVCGDLNRITIWTGVEFWPLRTQGKFLLRQGISEPVFYGDPVYEFKIIVRKPTFSDQCSGKILIMVYSYDFFLTVF